jgi:hypothetical protein
MFSHFQSRLDLMHLKKNLNDKLFLVKSSIISSTLLIFFSPPFIQAIPKKIIESVFCSAFPDTSTFESFCFKYHFFFLKIYF